jgi:hypothetical protein
LSVLVIEGVHTSSVQRRKKEKEEKKKERLMAKCSSKQSYSKREVHGDGLLMCSVDQLIWQLSDMVDLILI